MSNRLFSTIALIASLSSAPLFAQELNLRIGHTNAANEIQDIGLQRMNELLVEKTGNKAKLEIFPGGQLGDESQLIEGVMLGTIDLSMTSNSLLSNYIDDYKVFDMPFLFPTIQGLGEKLDANADLMQASANAKGFQLLGVFSSGLRHLMTKKPVEKIEDLAGLKIRTMQNPIHVEAWRAYGANPTPMSYNELYGALQAGVVDGAEGASSGYDGMKFYEVAPDFALVGWLNMAAPVVMQKAAFDALPAEVQTALMEAGSEAAKWQRGYVEEQEQPLIDKFLAAGAKITRPDVTPFQEASIPLYEATLTSDGQKALLKAMTE